MRAAGYHAAVLRDGPAALVPFPVGGGDWVGPGDPGGGPGFLPVDSAGGQAGPGAPRTGGARVRRGGKDAVNPVTGKPAPAVTYAAATRAHSESVLRAFYDLHLEAGTGPMVNPFPLSRSRRGGRANAHHNPAEPYRDERSGRYRPVVVQRMPRCIPDKKFDQLFSALPSNRDRALAAFWVSTGARASELLGATTGDTDPGQQLITVIRKGTRFMQQLPHRRTRSSGCGCIRRRWRAWCLPGGISRCGGLCCARSAGGTPRTGDVRPGECGAGRQLGTS